MSHYILRRILLIIPTIIGILTVTFVLVQFTPGGPVETIMARMQGEGGLSSSNMLISEMKDNKDLIKKEGSSEQQVALKKESAYTASKGVDPKFVEDLKKQFGFDKPPLVRYFKMLWDYARFDLGNSFFKGESVMHLIGEALPISASLGFWQLFISYIIAIPLGIRKAVKDGTQFDVWTSTVIIIGYAIPPFLLGMILLVFFAGGSFLNIFPLSHMVSDGFADMSLGHKILDYFWHLILPLSSSVIAGFATTTFLTKNCFLEEIRKQYVMTARAKGVSERDILYKHVFRNAILVVIASFPAAFVIAFTTSSILIETVFSLNGVGLLGYDAVVNRDYPVVFGTLFIFSLLGLICNLLADITCAFIDPRIDFEKRDV